MLSEDNLIYLASRSPRRQELLHQIAVRFEILDIPVQNPAHPDMVDETVRSGEKANDYVKRLAREKAEYAWQFLQTQNRKKRPVLTADTTVVIGERILGKPQNRKEAFDMLSLLSGKCIGSLPV